MGIGTTVARLATAVDDSQANLDDAKYALGTRRARATIGVAAGAAGALRLPVAVMEQPYELVAARIVSADTQTAGANSVSYAIRKHDGAGGAAAALSSTIVGTATTLTANVTASFAGITAADTGAKNDVLELDITVNGTGLAAAVEAILVELEYKYI